MTSIHLDDHVANSLESLARLQGLSLPDYLAFIARAETGAFAISQLSGDQILRMIDAESSATPSHYCGTYSRDEIYCDHD